MAGRLSDESGGASLKTGQVSCPKLMGGMASASGAVETALSRLRLWLQWVSVARNTMPLLLVLSNASGMLLTERGAGGVLVKSGMMDWVLSRTSGFSRRRRGGGRCAASVRF